MPTRIVDAHNDLLLELAFRSFRRGESDVFARCWLPHLRAGGVALQVCALYADLPVLPESALREVLGQVAAFERAVRENGDEVVAVGSRADLEPVERGERIGLMLSLEGAEALGYEPGLVDAFWRLGVRMLSLTWNRRNPFADGVAESRGAGLSELGRQLVDRCRELGLVVDLAHAVERTFWDVLERVDGAPVVVSHAACRAVHDHPRNLSDEQLRALAEAGGVLGVMLLPLVVDPAEPTIERAVDHVEHAVSVMGVEHVGLGSDFTRQVLRAVGWVEPADSLLPLGMNGDAAIEGLEGPQDFPALGDAIRRRGLDADAILGGNLLRLFREALP